MLKELIVFGFIAGGGPWTVKHYGPFKTMDECNVARQVMLHKTSEFWFNNWTVKECSKYRQRVEKHEVWEPIDNDTKHGQ